MPVGFTFPAATSLIAHPTVRVYLGLPSQFPTVGADLGQPFRARFARMTKKGATKVAPYGRYGKRTGRDCPFETVYSAAAMTSPRRWMPSRMVSSSALVKFKRMVERAPGSG